MKKLILALALPIAFMTSAFADQALCEREDIKQMKGENGSCQLVVVPAETPSITGRCEGKLGGVIPCTVAYAASNYGAAIMFKCEEFGQTMQAEPSSHRALAIVTDEKGNQQIVQDENTYMSLATNFVDINISMKDGEKTHEILFNLQGMRMSIQDISCI